MVYYAIHGFYAEQVKSDSRSLAFDQGKIFMIDCRLSFSPKKNTPEFFLASFIFSLSLV
jgi:hypothetical protein